MNSKISTAILFYVISLQINEISTLLLRFRKDTDLDNLTIYMSKKTWEWHVTGEYVDKTESITICSPKVSHAQKLSACKAILNEVRRKKQATSDESEEEEIGDVTAQPTETNCVPVGIWLEDTIMEKLNLKVVPMLRCPQDKRYYITKSIIPRALTLCKQQQNSEILEKYLHRNPDVKTASVGIPVVLVDYIMDGDLGPMTDKAPTNNGNGLQFKENVLDELVQAWSSMGIETDYTDEDSYKTDESDFTQGVETDDDSYETDESDA